LPFELPIPEKSSFRSMFFTKLEALLGDISEKFIDQMYWANLYLNGIDYLISTPRDINRLINTLRITYPIVKGEVNPYDFIAVEAIRITYPDLYDSIRKQEDLFIGRVSEYGIFAPNLEDHESFHTELLASIGEEHKKCIKNILTTLFPKLHRFYGTADYGHSESDCRKKLRICSPDIFYAISG
jgi:predicted KAP-like P-loop ATPase